MFGSKRSIYYIDSRRSDAGLLVSRRLSSLLTRSQKAAPVFLCIGSDRITGDSLGPIIGTELKKCFDGKIPVYGTLELPVHALNLSSVLTEIQAHHAGNTLIAIDASLGLPEHEGYITLGRGGLMPGAGVRKELGNVGDLFITGIVGPSGCHSHLTLQTARLSAVISVASRITDGIICTLARSVS